MPGFSVIAMFRLTRLYLAMPDDAAAAIWLFQKANLRPKLVCTKSFTDELKLCWPPPAQL
jgi:hypothetical protein